MPDVKVTIRLIEAGDRLTGLSLGDAAFTPLKTFLQRHAKAYQHASLARTYGAFLEGRIVGYITLRCGEIALDDGDAALVQDELQYSYNQYPAIKIARLAVARAHAGNGIGRLLVELALGIAADSISPYVGCRFVVVDSKRQSVGFYNNVGFTMLNTPSNEVRDEPVMFLDLLRAQSATTG